MGMTLMQPTDEATTWLTSKRPIGHQTIRYPPDMSGTGLLFESPTLLPPLTLSNQSISQVQARKYVIDPIHS